MTANHSALVRDMRNVANEVEHLLRDAGMASSGTVHQLRGRVADAVGAARARFDDLNTNVRSGATHALSATDEYVHASPWQAVGAGLLVGLLAGLLIMRRY